jgi:serine/threonine protein kinase
MAALAVPEPAFREPSGLEAYGYSIVKFLGQGGMGSVFKGQYIGAERRGLVEPHQPVALKFVPAQQVFPREVLIQAQMQHKFIISVYDVFPCVPEPDLSVEPVWARHGTMLFILVGRLCETTQTPGQVHVNQNQFDGVSEDPNTVQFMHALLACICSGIP